MRSRRADLILTVEEELIRTHVDDILERGFVVLMEGQKVLDLQRMFSLLARVNSLPKLCDTFRNYVVVGSSIPFIVHVEVLIVIALEGAAQQKGMYEEPDHPCGSFQCSTLDLPSCWTRKEMIRWWK